MPSVALMARLPTQVRRALENGIERLHNIDLSIVEERSLLLLLEIENPQDSIDAIEEFCGRYAWASHKIHKSVSGYFRGVCKKYWRRQALNKKENIMRSYRMARTPEEKNKLIDEVVGVLFTTASKLHKNVIDDHKRKILHKLPVKTIVEALYEYSTAAMYRDHKIRNANAYLLNIINRRIKSLRATSKAEENTCRRPKRPQRQGARPLVTSNLRGSSLRTSNSLSDKSTSYTPNKAPRLNRLPDGATVGRGGAGRGKRSPTSSAKGISTGTANAAGKNLKMASTAPPCANNTNNTNSNMITPRNMIQQKAAPAASPATSSSSANNNNNQNFNGGTKTTARLLSAQQRTSKQHVPTNNNIMTTTLGHNKSHHHHHPSAGGAKQMQRLAGVRGQAPRLPAGALNQQHAGSGRSSHKQPPSNFVTNNQQQQRGGRPSLSSSPSPSMAGSSHGGGHRASAGGRLPASLLGRTNSMNRPMPHQNRRGIDRRSGAGVKIPSIPPPPVRSEKSLLHSIDPSGAPSSPPGFAHSLRSMSANGMHDGHNEHLKCSERTSKTSSPEAEVQRRPRWDSFLPDYSGSSSERSHAAAIIRGAKNALHHKQREVTSKPEVEKQRSGSSIGSIGGGSLKGYDSPAGYDSVLRMRGESQREQSCGTSSLRSRCESPRSSAAGLTDASFGWNSSNSPRSSPEARARSARPPSPFNQPASRDELRGGSLPGTYDFADDNIGPSLIPRLSVPSANPAESVMRLTQSLSRCSSLASTPRADLGEIFMSDDFSLRSSGYLPSLRRGSWTNERTLNYRAEDEPTYSWASAERESGSMLDNAGDNQSFFGTQPAHFLKNRRSPDAMDVGSHEDGDISLFSSNSSASASMWRNNVKAFGVSDLLFSNSTVFHPAEAFFNPTSTKVVAAE